MVLRRLDRDNGCAGLQLDFPVLRLAEKSLAGERKERSAPYFALNRPGG
jgi:hypothetical protein